MPFVIHLNRDKTYKITNADTGRVYAYATTKPAQVMSIVSRYGDNSKQKRKSALRTSRKSQRASRRTSRRKSQKK